MKNKARAILLFAIFSIAALLLFSICGEPGVYLYGQKKNIFESFYEILFYPAIFFYEHIFKTIFLSMIANVLLYAIIVELVIEYFEKRKKLN